MRWVTKLPEPGRPFPGLISKQASSLVTRPGRHAGAGAGRKTHAAEECWERWDDF